VLILYGVSLLLGSAAVVVTTARNSVSILVLTVLALIAFVCVRVFGGVRITDLWGRMKDEMERRQRSADAKISVEKTLIQMRTASKPLEVWEALSASLESLGLDYAKLRLFGISGSQPLLLSWPDSGREAIKWPIQDSDFWFARFTVQSNGHLLGELEVGKAVQKTSPLPDMPELVDRLRRELAAQVERLSSREHGATSKE
jgi:hypothetical protein